MQHQRILHNMVTRARRGQIKADPVLFSGIALNESVMVSLCCPRLYQLCKELIFKPLMQGKRVNIMEDEHK